LRIWFDILTPKQILFFEPMIRHLQKSNKILCTSRNYREATELAKLRKMKIEFVGKHGGATKSEKLSSSLDRMSRLYRRIIEFDPELTVSFCSPEAARISFGLGVKHVAFCDSPHAEAVMRLSVPLVQKLLTPWIIPKKEFAKFGISEKNIIHYKAIDAALIVRCSRKNKSKRRGRKNILIRMGEDQAAYAKQSKAFEIIQAVASKFASENVIVMPRYKSQIVALKKLGSKVRVLNKVVVGSDILQDTDVFVGSGGTMTAEAALSGIPTISYDAVPNIIQDYLVKQKMVTLESDPSKVALLVAKMLHADNKVIQERARKMVDLMEDPLEKLVHVIGTKNST
jgi:uncharacterized protein